jgi:hypothetical protein
LRPHGQREQNQAKRRYGQPAPHTHIIAQFDSYQCGENGLRQREGRPRKVAEKVWFVSRVSL